MKLDIVKTKDNIAFDINKKVIDLKKEVEGNFIKLGAYLKEIKEKRLYIDLSYNTFEEYIAQPDLSLNRRVVYSIIGVYEDFVCNQSHIDMEEIKKIGYTKLERIRQFKEQPDFDEWIYKAKTLSLSDLGAEIKETKGVSENLSSTKSEDKITMEITCPFCGKKFDYLVKQCII